MFQRNSRCTIASNIKTIYDFIFTRYFWVLCGGRGIARKIPVTETNLAQVTSSQVRSCVSLKSQSWVKNWRFLSVISESPLRNRNRAIPSVPNGGIVTLPFDGQRTTCSKETGSTFIVTVRIDGRPVWSQCVVRCLKNIKNPLKSRIQKNLRRTSIISIQRKRHPSKNHDQTYRCFF